jgi:acetyltransferase-like isoleucine patch superfamily enzyme
MKLYILGNGGFAHEIFEQVFLQTYRDDFGGFITLKGDEAFVISEAGVELFSFPSYAQFILGVTDKKSRDNFLQILAPHYEITRQHFPNISASDAHISKLAIMGIGNVFCSFSMLNANACIGNFNCVNMYASISHNCVVGDYNTLSPYAGIMGYCTIGNNNFLGPHSTIVSKVRIGNENMINAGECLFDDMTTKELFQSGIITKNHDNTF